MALSKIWMLLSTAAVAFTCDGVALAQSSSDVAGQTDSTPAATAATPTTPATTEAPDSAAAAGAGQGDIIVTAQRRSQRLQDVPVAATVVSGLQLARQGINDLTELSTRLPGLKLGASTQSDILSIRGISSGNATGFEQAVGTFVDGVYRGRSRSARAALFDVERVEVLKGPQTTFFGNNTIAGALNITTRKPTDTFSYNATGLYAPTDGEFNAEAGVSGPITSTLSARVAGKYSGMNGYIHNDYLNQDSPHLRDFVGRISLKWQPTSNLTSNLRFDYVRNRDHGQYTPELIDCPPPTQYGAAKGDCAKYLAQAGGPVDDKLNYHAATAPSFFRLNVYETAWNNDLKLGAFTLSSLSSYFHQYANTFIATRAAPVPGNGNTINGNPFQTFEKYESYSQEVRLQSPTGGFLEYMVGGYFLHGQLDTVAYAGTYGTAAGAAGAPVTSATTPIVGVRNLDQTERTLSAFGSVTLNFTSRLKLNVGLRYTDVRKEASRSTQAGIGGYIPGPDYTRVPAATEAALLKAVGFNDLPFANPKRDYHDLMPAVSLQFKLNRDITSYVSYTEGFLAGGFTDTGTPQQFDSEFVKAYEIGVKGSAFDRALTFNLDLFQSNYSNLQESFSFNSPIPPFVVLSEIRNVAAARSRGVEFNGTYRATDWLSFNTDMTYNQATYVRYPGAPCTVLQTLQVGATCTQDLSGRPRILAPKFSGVIGATATIPVGSTYTIGISPQVYHSSRYNISPSLEPQLEQKSYEKVDLRIDFGPRDRRWEVAVLGKNLNNAITTTVGTVFPAAAGTVIEIPDRARSVAVQFTVHN